MIKPNIPNMSNIPGMGAMTDTLDFVKNLWGSMGLPGMNVPGMSAMNVPGMVMPTLSVDEINKKISDLKAVESWLNLNMSMLRSTIQALEVQAATISTLQTMGERFSATMNPAAGQDAGQSAGSSNGASASNGASGNGGIHAERDHGKAPEPTTKDEQDAASLTAPLVNAAAWWNMLQEQFKQAVNTAMTETQAVAAAATAPVTVTEKPKAKSSAKPKASSSSSSASSSSSSSAPRKRKTSK